MPIQQQNIVNEMEKSYLEYAMSVIIARALPDVRDGLKPVHRRILVTMNDLGLRHTAKHRKSAKICGDVSGNYHPHGESIVYPSMVRLAQEFAMRSPLVDGQGNFGSIDGDNPAAMRYTEARMTKIAEEMLKDIEKKTVDFVDNYDGTRQEPKVLPARLPQLLLNGTLGIAVGMATNIPPHNLSEVCAGLIALIDKIEVKSEILNSKSETNSKISNQNDPNQEFEKLEHSNLDIVSNLDISASNLKSGNFIFDSLITIPELMKHIKGPDFPTGAEIYAGNGLVEAYQTGRGKINVRGVAEIIDEKNQTKIIITEIPYQVNKAELVTKIALLVTDKKITEISDIRDESDRKGIRIVIDLKKNSYPKKILNTLFSQTSLQTSYHFNTLALINGIEPRILNLKEILTYFVQFRHQVITRRSQFELNQALARAHILEGFLKALDIIDAVIETIRQSETREIAFKALMAKFQFSDRQTNAILEMRLSSLVGLERDKLSQEYKEKKELIAYLKDLLAHPEKILEVIKTEIQEIKENYPQKRKSKIINQELSIFKTEDIIPDEQVLITLTKTGYIKKISINQYHDQGRGGKGVIGITTKDEDEVDIMMIANTHESIYFFTDQGKIYRSKVYEIPTTSRQAKGTALPNILSISSEEKVTAILTKRNDSGSDNQNYFFMGTEKGVVKKTLISAFNNVRTNGIIAIKLTTGDRLRWVSISKPDQLITELSLKGQCIIYKESDVRPMGRSAAGVIGMKLRSNDAVISLSVLSKEELRQKQILTVLENGFGKRSNLSLFDIQKRGGIGIKAANVTEKTGELIEAIVVDKQELGSAVLVSKLGNVIKIKIKNIKSLGRVTQGVTLMKLNSGDKVASVAIVPESEIEEITP